MANKLREPGIMKGVDDASDNDDPPIPDSSSLRQIIYGQMDYV